MLFIYGSIRKFLKLFFNDEISALQTLKSAEPESWQIRNNLGVCHFHQMKIIDSTKEFESCLQSQILSTGVLSPQIIFPIQRNLFTLNEMFKK